MQFVVSSEVFGPNRNDETKAITTQESEGRLFVEGQHDGLYKPLVAKASYHCWLLSPVNKIGGAVDEGELTTHAITYESAENEKQPRKCCQSCVYLAVLEWRLQADRPLLRVAISLLDRRPVVLGGKRENKHPPQLPDRNRKKQPVQARNRPDARLIHQPVQCCPPSRNRLDRVGPGLRAARWPCPDRRGHGPRLGVLGQQHHPSTPSSDARSEWPWRSHCRQ